MPIFFQQETDATTRLAIWKIEEDEAFFTASVPLQRNITHPHKRQQHLAGRYLLRYLFADFPIDLIQIADTRKPFLEDEAYHFSISHCGDFAAVIVSKTRRVGMDIELFTEKVQRIRHKFISVREEEIINNQQSIFNTPSTNPLISQSTLIWSCKEALFKWYGLGNVDFRADIQVQQIEMVGANQFETAVFLKKNGDHLRLHSQFFDTLCLSFIIT
ncbi:MAG: hypothetical protein JWP88_407 [Flaviaesturariibacter sp.]|nr:hypothetical protein [Flaviaesturariibacter sp.]